MNCSFKLLNFTVTKLFGSLVSSKHAECADLVVKLLFELWNEDVSPFLGKIGVEHHIRKDFLT